jgi:hypothetical protein
MSKQPPATPDAAQAVGITAITRLADCCSSASFASADTPLIA